jgi:hypothetical protein
LHYHASTHNKCSSFCSNVKEKEEGGGAPSSSFLDVVFLPWCFRLAITTIEKEEEENEGKKEARKKKGERRKKEGRRKKIKIGI